jgi:hypothetical protein
MNKHGRNRAKDSSSTTTNVVAWRIPAWCKALSISRAQYYVLVARGGIEVIYLGTMPLIKTSPEAYLAWAAEQQKIAATASVETDGDSAPVVRRRGRSRRVAAGEPAPTAPALAALSDQS